jgi:hypothetical protein
LNYEVIENISGQEICGYFDICTKYGTNIIQKAEILQSKKTVTIENVTFDDLSDTFEHRVFSSNGSKLKIISIEVQVKS